MTTPLATIGTVASLIGVGANIISDYANEKKRTAEIEAKIAEKVAEEVAKQLEKSKT